MENEILKKDRAFYGEHKTTRDLFVSVDRKNVKPVECYSANEKMRVYLSDAIRPFMAENQYYADDRVCIPKGTTVTITEAYKNYRSVILFPIPVSAKLNCWYDITFVMENNRHEYSFFTKKSDFYRMAKAKNLLPLAPVGMESE
ncbi:MAG: hypothetical protein IJ678_03080 [Kiritimatiellae bacterium]|nr:hypothetical protein [Kiritimatiellia bacterium]